MPTEEEEQASAHTLVTPIVSHSPSEIQIRRLSLLLVAFVWLGARAGYSQDTYHAYSFTTLTRPLPTPKESGVTNAVSHLSPEAGELDLGRSSSHGRHPILLRLRRRRGRRKKQRAEQQQ